MRIARSLLALAALCTAAACADGASRITAPEAASHDGAPVGGWIGSGNVTAPAPEDGGGWGGSGNVASSDGTWVGSGNAVAPNDSTGNGRGGWAGSGN